MKTCEAEGCDRPVTNRGRWCTTHHNRHYRHGDVNRVVAPAERRKNLRADNVRWVGDKVSYYGLHNRLLRFRGPASDQKCVDCGKTAKEWSYRGGAPDERIVPVGRYATMIAYSADLTFYDPRCVPCHRAFDKSEEAV